MCQIRVGLAQHDYGIITSTWLLLDTCYTSSVSNHPYTFKNIWECLEQDILNVVFNGENKTLNEISEYELFTIEAHFNLHSIANIVALMGVADVPGVRIIMDSSNQRAITWDYQGKI